MRAPVMMLPLLLLPLAGCGARVLPGYLTVDLAAAVGGLAHGRCVAGVARAWSIDAAGVQHTTVTDLSFDTCASPLLEVPCRDGRGTTDTTILLEVRSVHGGAGPSAPLRRTAVLRADCRGQASPQLSGGASVALGETSQDGTVTASVGFTAESVSLSFLRQPSCSSGQGQHFWVAAPVSFRRLTVVSGSYVVEGAPDAALDAAAFGAHGALSFFPAEITDASGETFLDLRYGLRFDWAGHPLAGSIHDLLLPGAAIDALLPDRSGAVHLAQVLHVSAAATFAGEPDGCTAPGLASVGLLSKLHLSLAGPAVTGLQQEIVAGSSIRMAALSGSIAGRGLASAASFQSAAAEFTDPTIEGLSPCPSADSLIVLGTDATDHRLRAIVPTWDGASFTFGAEDLVPGAESFAACFP